MKTAPTAALALSLTAASAAAQLQHAELTATDPGALDLFGSSVSLSFPRALVGARWDSDDGSASGSAYVFLRESSGWVQEAKLTAADAAMHDWFGGAVALDGDVAVVGATGEDDGGNGAGAAYVFERGPGGWTQTAKLLAADATGLDSFGNAVDVDGTRVVVGASRKSGAVYSAGAVYVFEKGPSGWGQMAKLLASDGTTNDFYGASVAVSGDRILVGAWQDDDKGTSSGSAYVYDLGPTGWVETTKLLAADGKSADFLGESVDLSGDTAIVGARGKDGGWAGIGAAYVFELGPTGWAQTARLTEEGGASDDWFGRSVSVDGSFAVVGADGDDGAATGAGAAYLYERGPSGWSLLAKVHASDAAAGDQLGVSVSVDGSLALVGAPGDDDGASDAGASYLFQGCTSPIGAIETDVPALSLSVGGVQSLALTTCPPQTDSLVYLVLGSLSPGVLPIDGVTLPITVDAYLLFTLESANAGVFGSTLGTLDGSGSAMATIAVPAGTSPSLAGTSLLHAFVAFDVGGIPEAVLGSEAVVLGLVP